MVLTSSQLRTATERIECAWPVTTVTATATGTAAPVPTDPALGQP